MITIVTDHCYIRADKIHHVSIEENGQDGFRKGRRIREYDIYDIKVYYGMITNGNAGREERVAEIRILNKVNARRVFTEIVEQIRDQDPDKAHVDMLIGKYLLGNDSTDSKGTNDGSADTVCRTRKAKRKSKKVLRGS